MLPLAQVAGLPRTSVAGPKLISHHHEMTSERDTRILSSEFQHLCGARIHQDQASMASGACSIVLSFMVMDLHIKASMGPVL